MKEFIKSIYSCAPLASGTKNKNKSDGSKMPYKPAFCLAFFYTAKLQQEDIFNKWWDFSVIDNHSFQYTVIKKYYDILTWFPKIYNKLRTHISKENQITLDIRFDYDVYKNLVKQVFDKPLFYLNKCREKGSTFIEIDKNNKLLKFNYSGNEILKTLDEIIINSYESLKRTKLGYENRTLDEIINKYNEFYENIQKGINSSQKYSRVKRREYQHIWAKQIKDKHPMCVICCEKIPWLLQAAHIKPFSLCENEIQQYDEKNGITLCMNHHKLFDLGYFTFNEDWTIDISDADEFKFFKTDFDLLIKKIEPCWGQLKQNKACFLTEYMEYHHNYIFKKNKKETTK